MLPRYYPKLPRTGKKHQITFASSQWSFTFLNCIQSSDQHHVELTNLSITKSSAFSDTEIIGFGDRYSGHKCLTMPGDLGTKVTIKREVKVTGGPMRGGHNTSIDV